jgi:hypothetical protein
MFRCCLCKLAFWLQCQHLNNKEFNCIIIIIIIIITRYFKEVSALSVTCKNLSAVPFLTAVNLVYRDVHIFRKRNLKRILL